MYWNGTFFSFHTPDMLHALDIDTVHARHTAWPIAQAFAVRHPFSFPYASNEYACGAFGAIYAILYGITWYTIFWHKFAVETASFNHAEHYTVGTWCRSFNIHPTILML